MVIVSQCTEQPPGCSERALGGQEVGTDPREGSLWSQLSLQLRVDIVYRSTLRKLLKKPPNVKSRKNYVIAMLTRSGNVRGASEDVDVEGGLAEADRTTIDGFHDTLALHQLGAGSLQKETAIVGRLSGEK